MDGTRTMIIVEHNGKLQSVGSIPVIYNNTSRYVKQVLVEHKGVFRVVWENTVNQIVIIEEGKTVFNVDLVTLFDRGNAKGVFTLINNGSIGSRSATSPSLIVQNFVDGSEINIINNGNIIGKGGTGVGLGSIKTNLWTENAENGGTALELHQKTSITNTGTIGGGGGGGGGGRGEFVPPSNTGTIAPQGGGGAGLVAGSARPSDVANFIGYQGTLEAGGRGSRATTFFDQLWIQSGNGGALGQDGTPVTAHESLVYTAYPNGKGGSAILSNDTRSTYTGTGRLLGYYDI